MYLSRVELDISKKRTQIALNSRNKFHGAVESSFEKDYHLKKRHLWRLDNLKGKKYLMLVSEDEPELRNLATQFGKNESAYEIKKYDDFLNNIQNESCWRFRLVANPTKSVKNVSGRGKLVAHITPEHQMKWLEKKADANGFDVDISKSEIKESRWLMFEKNGKHMVKILAVTFEGILTVTDTDKFKYALTNGIGREKAYGMGMMTIMR